MLKSVFKLFDGKAFNIDDFPLTFTFVKNLILEMFICICLMNVFIEKSCHYQCALASSFSYIYIYISRLKANKNY
jgi:hypothetical protein